MKKITLLFLLLSVFTLNAQTDFLTALPNNNGTSQNGRAPQGFDRYNRSVWLISAADMAAAGFVTGDAILSIGFNYTADVNGDFQDVSTTGSFKVYLQNTADVTNTKSTTWATAIASMTLASDANATIPAALGTVDFLFSNGTAFSYTGGAIYVATDYQNASGTVAAIPNTALCNNTLAGGLKGARSSTAIPTITVASAFRPETRLGKSVACATPVNVAIPSTTDTTANLTFSASDPANIEFGAYDFLPGTAAGTIVTSVPSGYTITGLAPSSAYEVYAKTNCGSFLGLSLTAAPVSFHTPYYPANPNYTTSFEIDNFPNIGWLEDVEVNGSEWFTNFGGTGSVLVQNGLYSAVSLSNATAASNGRMYSRGVNLQAGSPATVSFYARNFQNTSTNNASFVVTAGTAQTAAAQTIPVGTDAALSSATFVLKSYTFVPATTGVYYIGFLHNSPINAAGTHGIIVDNFTVSQALATDQFLDSKFATYPNPAKNVINVSNTTDALLSTIEMTDINGKIVKNIKLSNVSEAEVTVSDLSTGIYTMKITSDKGIVTKKIIKE